METDSSLRANLLLSKKNIIQHAYQINTTGVMDGCSNLVSCIAV